MTIDNHIRRVGQLANRNAPVLLTAVAITGVAATAYLAAKASWNAVRRFKRKRVRTVFLTTRM